MSNNSVEDLLYKYDEKKLLFTRCEQSIKKLIETLMENNNITMHAIESRVKEKESLLKKIEKKNKYNNLDEITDIVGLRLITYLETDVNVVADILKEEFDLDYVNSVDKREVADPDRFGYTSLHYILKLKEPRASLSEYSYFKEINFEIQIRSILQHAWAEIEHDLGYKSENEVPDAIRRSFSRVSSLLELADMEFNRIKKELSIYGAEIEKEFINNNFDEKLNKLSYLKYVKNSKVLNEIRDEINNILPGITFKNESEYISALKEVFGLKTIKELDDLLNKNKNNIPKFFKEFLNNDKKEGEIYPVFPMDVPIFYLCYLLVFKSDGYEKFKEFAFYNNFDEDVVNKLEYIFKKIEENGLNLD